jgi:hypothetical protein
LRFSGAGGEKFFRSTLVQTLFYSVFSFWVLWVRGPSRNHGSRFDWRTAFFDARVPVVGAVFGFLLRSPRLKALDLENLMDMTGSVLNRVDPGAFFAQFHEEKAVQYFYEPFLQAYDPELRKKLGVWYTPEEIVKYQVSRVDQVLRQELGIADGLADPNVFVLDPCCGTGAYLVEVLRRIHLTLKDNSVGEVVRGLRVKEAALQRVFGFEVLPAPFVISHLQLGMLLQTSEKEGGFGAPLEEGKNERVAVYLTNALTGWEPPTAPKDRFLFSEMDDERDAADRVKRDVRILVVLGNPPYNAFAGTSPVEEQGLVDAYKAKLNTPVAKGGWGIGKFNLDDLFIRFFRLAEKRVAESTGRGVVSFISPSSWLTERSFVVMRKRLLTQFDAFWVENLHGNRRVSERTAEGKTSETVFATPGFSAGIQQGVATSLWVKRGDHQRPQLAAVLHRDDIDSARALDRRKELLDSLLEADFDAKYRRVSPSAANRYSMTPVSVSEEYLTWPKLTDLCVEAPSYGLMEKRGGALIDGDRAALESRMRRYLDGTVSYDTLARECHPLASNAARYDAAEARKKILAIETYRTESIRRYAQRPFDHCWCYYTPVRPIWNEPRPTFWAECWEGNSFIVSRGNCSRTPEGVPLYFVRGLFDDHLLTPDAAGFPIRIRVGCAPFLPLFAGRNVSAEVRERANLSGTGRDYLGALGIAGVDDSVDVSELVWLHALAIGHAPEYTRENADGIRGDWPRIPMPATRERLRSSAEIGRSVAALLNLDGGIPGVSTGPLRQELRQLAVFSDAGSSLHRGHERFAVVAGWGHAGKEGVIMPGKGRLTERQYSEEELGTLCRGADELGMRVEQVLDCLGQSTLDVWLNEHACWRNVPFRVWNYHVGGHHVLKKWLSYREEDVLGRPLTLNEVDHVTQVVRRLGALVLLEPHLDANYAAVKADVYTWPQPKAEAPVGEDQGEADGD